MGITATLEAIYSKRDRAGNCSWAFRYTDHASGKTVCATISGGESNIYGILRETDEAKRTNDWDRSVRFECHALKIRGWNRLTKGWGYAGCVPADLYKYIKAQLSGEVQS